MSRILRHLNGREVLWSGEKRSNYLRMLVISENLADFRSRKVYKGAPPFLRLIRGVLGKSRRYRYRLQGFTNPHQVCSRIHRISSIVKFRRIYRKRMLSNYPDYRKQRIAAHDVEKELAEREREIIAGFIEYCAISAGEKKCRDIRTVIVQIRHVFDMPFDAWQLPDLRAFLAVLNRSGKRDWTVHGIKVSLKRFIRWFYPDWPTRFDNLRDVRQRKVSTQDKYRSSHLLTKEDGETDVPP